MTVIRSRAQWGARPPVKPSVPLVLPTPELWLHHTAGPEQGDSGMLAIQRAHIAKGWSDVGYSFVIDPYDLIVYEGRGAGVIGAHTEGHNSRAHGICVMGDYETHLRPTDSTVHLIADLVAYGHRRGWWPDHLTGGHRDTKATACPGKYLYAAIRRINAEAEAILAGDIPPDSQETPGMAPLSFSAAQERSQRALNMWLPEHLRIASDGQWGDKSDAALKFVLDEVAGPTIRKLEEANTALTATNESLHTQVRDLLAQINANQAGAGVDARTVALATIGAKTLEWVDTVTTESNRITGSN